MSDRARAIVLVADLGTPKVAAFTARLNGVRIAVVHPLAREDPAIRREAALALTAAGVDLETITEVLNGIRG